MITSLCDAGTYHGLSVDPQSATARGSSCNVGRSTQAEVDLNLPSKLRSGIVLPKYVCSPTSLDQSPSRALGLTACRKIRRNWSALHAPGHVRLAKRWEYGDEW